MKQLKTKSLKQTDKQMDKKSNNGINPERGILQRRSLVSVLGNIPQYSRLRNIPLNRVW
jgi:hypothetical protein